MIEISNDYSLKSSGRFTAELSHPTQFKERMQKLTSSFKNLATTFLNLLGGDAKITGPEKRLLIDTMEEILHLTLMMRRLDFSPEQSNVNITKGNGQFTVDINFSDRFLWELNGSMAPGHKIKIGSFKDWFNTVLSEKLRGFLTEYGNATIDKDLSQEEREKISKRLDQVCIEILEMVVHVERFMKFQ